MAERLRKLGDGLQWTMKQEQIAAKKHRREEARHKKKALAHYKRGDHLNAKLEARNAILAADQALARENSIDKYHGLYINTMSMSANTQQISSMVYAANAMHSAMRGFDPTEAAAAAKFIEDKIEDLEVSTKLLENSMSSGAGMGSSVADRTEDLLEQLNAPASETSAVSREVTLLRKLVDEGMPGGQASAQPRSSSSPAASTSPGERIREQIAAMR